jgi:hypothetical protein
VRLINSKKNNRKLISVSCPEKTAALGLGPGADSPLASNFLYGRPHPSLLDRSSHSSTTIRPIGFYYEDEQPYEGGGIGGIGRHGRDNSQEAILHK